MEAYMYRCHPQTDRLVELIRDGAIGHVRVIQASFGIDFPFDPQHRAFASALGGGGILDLGCYPVSTARLIAGAATGRPFAEPIEVQGAGHIGEARTDEYAAATLVFPEAIIAQIFTAMRLQGDNHLRILGTEGSIVVPTPWLFSVDGGSSSIWLHRHDREQAEEIVIQSERGLYTIEADTVASHLAERQAPAMTWDDTLGNMRTLDRWREAIGLVYDRETVAGQALPLHGRPLSRRADHNMSYGQIQGIHKPVSRLVMGVDNQRTLAHASVMFDDFVERGGTCFDTAYIYGQGLQERLLGQWVKSRGVRESVVILDKGAHTPLCTPEWMARQFAESLERLQTDYVDIYMLHRDNPQVPVGEFIAALNEQLAAGRMRAFGASNWSIERVNEANSWARDHGLQGFVAMSSNFSLARMVDPVWAGCIAASDPRSRAWLYETQMPLMPWSSQARGFFTERANPDDRSDPELVRCWYSDDNFLRRERAVELARRKGVLPINIALAYVLCQPFPTFALIGPRALSETRSSFQALGIQLSPEEVRWLNLEGELP
jgi:aryl-alcohol dehydrogenase-like predicted oxidoreductase